MGQRAENSRQQAAGREAESVGPTRSLESPVQGLKDSMDATDSIGSEGLTFGPEGDQKATRRECRGGRLRSGLGMA